MSRIPDQGQGSHRRSTSQLRSSSVHEQNNDAKRRHSTMTSSEKSKTSFFSDLFRSSDNNIAKTIKKVNTYIGQLEKEVNRYKLNFASLIVQRRDMGLDITNKIDEVHRCMQMEKLPYLQQCSSLQTSLFDNQEAIYKLVLVSTKEKMATCNELIDYAAEHRSKKKAIMNVPADFFIPPADLVAAHPRMKKLLTERKQLQADMKSAQDNYAKLCRSIAAAESLVQRETFLRSLAKEFHEYYTSLSAELRYLPARDFELKMSKFLLDQRWEEGRIFAAWLVKLETTTSSSSSNNNNNNTPSGRDGKSKASPTVSRTSRALIEDPATERMAKNERVRAFFTRFLSSVMMTHKVASEHEQSCRLLGERVIFPHVWDKIRLSELNDVQNEEKIYRDKIRILLQVSGEDLGMEPAFVFPGEELLTKYMDAVAEAKEAKAAKDAAAQKRQEEHDAEMERIKAKVRESLWDDGELNPAPAEQEEDEEQRSVTLMRILTGKDSDILSVQDRKAHEAAESPSTPARSVTTPATKDENKRMNRRSKLITPMKQMKVPYYNAVRALEDITQLYVPKDMLRCLLHCSSLIYASAADYAGANKLAANPDKGIDLDKLALSGLGADGFFPILLFVVVHAKLPGIVERLRLMEAYAANEDVIGELGYYLTSFHSAMHFIMSYGDDKNKMDPIKEEEATIVKTESSDPEMTRADVDIDAHVNDADISRRHTRHRSSLNVNLPSSLSSNSYNVRPSLKGLSENVFEEVVQEGEEKEPQSIEDKKEPLHVGSVEDYVVPASPPDSPVIAALVPAEEPTIPVAKVMEAVAPASTEAKEAKQPLTAEERTESLEDQRLMLALAAEHPPVEAEEEEEDPLGDFFSQIHEEDRERGISDIFKNMGFN